MAPTINGVPRQADRSRRWHALASLCVALALAFVGCGDAEPSSAVAPDPRLIVGLGANTLEGGLGHEQDVVRQLGVRHLREELNWPRVEPRRGRFRWSGFDRMLAEAARRHMTVLPTLQQTPRWLGRDPDRLPPPAAWARYVSRVVARYGPGGRFWRAHPELDSALAPRWFELWNEPYYDAFSAGGPDPVRFAAIQRAAVQAGRAANPAARFLMPGETDYTGRDGGEHDWLADLYAADPALNEVFDGVVAHPYGIGSPLHTDGSRRAQTLRLDDLLAELDAHGAADRPVWVTEIGWSTCRLRPECTGESDQAEYLREFFDLVATRWRGRVQAVFPYHLHDFAAGDPDDPQQHYGLLRRDGSRKRAWYVVRGGARAAG